MNELKYKKLNPHVWEYLILLAILLLGLAVRSYLVTYNLPVASNVDERAMLRIFYKLDREHTLNPGFFSYPTLYFYLNYFLLKPFIDLKEFLYSGRIVNSLLSCFLAAGTFWLSKQVYKATIPSLLAAAFIMFSPTIIYSASYIITDIQLALFCVLSLLCLSRFFETYEYRSWLLGISCMGLAFATKYSAITLVGAYFIMEIMHSKFLIKDNERNHSFIKILNTRIATKYISLFLILGCLSGLCLYLFFPYQLIGSVIEKARDLDSVFSQSDVAFVESLRSKFLALGLLSGGSAIISFCFQKFTERFGLLRPYVGIASTGILLILTSPFILISWQKFIYDFGAVMKHSHAGGSPQWIPYLQHYSAEESLLILLFMLVGLWHSWRLKQRTLFLVVYLLVSYAVLGSASEGFLRYLTPVLPVMFVIAAWGIYATGLWLTEKFGQRFLQNFLVIAVTAAIVVELSQKVSAQIFLPHDDMYASYAYIVEHKPSKVYYSVYAPDVELRLAGFEVEQLPLASLTQHNTEFLNRMRLKEVLIVDGEVISKMDSQLKRQLHLVWQSAQILDNGKTNFNNQFIFAKH